MNITYEIRRPSAEEEKASSEKFCIYTSTFRYTVYNHDSSDENYDVRVLIEKAWADELNKFTKILYLIVDKENVSGPQVEQADAAAPDLRFQVRYSHPIQVPAGGFREVEVCFQSVCYPRDTTTWTCVDPADSLDLTLKAPPEFRLYSILKHPKESKGEGWQVRPGEFRVATKLPCLPSTVVELAWFDPSSPLVNPGENVGGGKVAA